MKPNKFGFYAIHVVMTSMTWKLSFSLNNFFLDDLLDTVVVELVVRSQCWKSSGADGVSKEDLGGRVDPGLRVAQLGPVWSDVAHQADAGALQSDRSHQQNREDKVGKQSREPNNLQNGTKK